MAQIINFPSPAARRLRSAVMKYKKSLCTSCNATKPSLISRGKLCYGVKRFFLFGKNVCAVPVAHIHAKCTACGNSWVEA